MKKLFYIFALLAAVLSFNACEADKNDWKEWQIINENWMKEKADELRGKSNFVERPSGLCYETYVAGQGKQPFASSTVRVRYTMLNINGDVIDETDEGKSVYLYLPNTISGFSEGLTKMRVGGISTLYIPWDLGYGDEESVVEPYTTLIYRVELLEVTH